MIALGLAAALAAPTRAARFEETVEARAFVKGQLHCHTTESDGDLSPRGVADWYAAHGYAFLGISDHDKLTRLSSPPLTLIPAVEITSRAGRVPVHVNALCGASPIAGARLAGRREALADAAARARGDGALALVNHPNWYAALGPAELSAVEGFDMIEIASGHPAVGDEGDAAHPSAESLWQGLLDSGRRVRAAAVDDAHDFVHPSEGRVPGKAWIEAWGAGADAASACAALRAGRFYATTGPRLESLEISGERMALAVRDLPPGGVVEFVGRGGVLLGSSSATPAELRLRGDEAYVRARVRFPDGGRAWTQAYFVRP